MAKDSLAHSIGFEGFQLSIPAGVIVFISSGGFIRVFSPRGGVASFPR